MSKIRDMIDLIADENFDGAKSALKATLAEYMAGRKFLSNRDLYGKDYTNPNEEEQSIKAGLAESDNFDSVAFEKNMDRIKRNRFQPRHFLDDVEDDNVDTWDKLIAHPKYGQDFIADLDQLDFRAAYELSAGLSKSTKKDNWECMKPSCGKRFYSDLDWPECPSCGSKGDDFITPIKE